MTVILWLLIGVIWAQQLAHWFYTRAAKRLIETQRQLIASHQRANELLGKDVERLWVFYRGACPEAHAQPPHIEAALLAAAESLERQTNNSEGGEQS